MTQSIAKDFWAVRRNGQPRGQDNPRDFYVTPPQVIEALLDREKFYGTILEPACGSGAMADVLRARGYTVQDLHRGEDFLKRQDPVWNVVTNPPWRTSRAEQFVRKALSLAKLKVAMLLPLYFLEGRQRLDLFRSVKAVYIFAARPRFGHLKHSCPFGTCWAVWDRHHRGRTALGWVT
jgi:hypothetical protein